MKLFSLITNGRVFNSPILPGAVIVSPTLLLSRSSFFLLRTAGISLLGYLLNRLTLAFLLNRLILIFLLNRLILLFASAYSFYPAVITGAYKKLIGVKVTSKNYIVK